MDRVSGLVIKFGRGVGAESRSPEKIIIDTDIGDDVDDAFALALAVRSPEAAGVGGDDYVWRYGGAGEDC